ncbi:MAG: hypothetical protein U0271_40295 [Polyangiaceae bacterium]
MSTLTILIIVASTVVPIALIALVLGALFRSQAKTDELLKTGTPARARILQLGTTGMSVAVMGHRHLKLLLTVEVQQPGRPPYVATFDQLVSELQIPSVQPGTFIELRIDPNNPSRMALAGIIPPNQAGFAPQAGPPAGWGGQPGYGTPAAPMVMGVARPNYRSSLPMILVILFLTTVPITAIMLYTFVDFGSLFGKSQTTKDGKKVGNVCEQAAHCCKVVTGDSGSACDNYKEGPMPVEGCRSALEQYRDTAQKLGKSCD